MEYEGKDEQNALVTPELDLALMGANWEVVTAALNRKLQAMLEERLGGAGDFGRQLAQMNEVTQIDYYLDDGLAQDQEAKAESGPGELNRWLTGELRAMLAAEYGVPEPQARRTYVRRWGINYGAEGTAGCKYYEYKNGVYQEYCYRACSTC